MRRKRGLSLLEVVVAISLLYLVVTFVIQLLPTSLYAMMRSQSRLSGENLAHSQLQRQLRRPFTELSVGLKQSLPDLGLEGKNYSTTVEVLPAESEDPNHLRVLRVTVSWLDKSVTRRAMREQWIHSAY